METLPAGARLVRFCGVSKWYDEGPIRTTALDEASLRVDAGQSVVVLGPSGSGRTTLLNLPGAMDTPSGGTALVVVPAVERVSGEYRASAVRMDAFVRRHATATQYRERKVGAGIPETHVTERYFKRGQ